jgi:hypothetical protein
MHMFINKKWEVSKFKPLLKPWFVIVHESSSCKNRIYNFSNLKMALNITKFK